MRVLTVAALLVLLVAGGFVLLHSAQSYHSQSGSHAACYDFSSGNTATSASFKAQVSLGQTLVGEAQSANVKLSAGFAHGCLYAGLDPDADGALVPLDNCPVTSNPGQQNLDDDSKGDACDSDDDNDLVADADEPPCGGDPLDVTPPLSRPERLDLPGDDDGDTLINEALPVGAEPFDCDGDGYTGAAEAHVFTATNARDQDPCGTTAWPSDFISGGIPNSTNRVNITDLTSFLAPVHHFNTSPPELEYADRWDLVPGAGVFSKVINVTDLTALIAASSGFPPMLGGAKAFSGPSCPWPP